MTQATDEVSRACVVLVQHFQQAFKDVAAAAYAADPTLRRPCHGCAMNPSTNTWDGQEKTALGFLAAMAQRAEGHNYRFICHEGLHGWPDSGPYRGDDPAIAAQPDCAGFQVLAAMTTAEIAQALEHTVREVWGWDLDADRIARFLSAIADVVVA